MDNKELNEKLAKWARVKPEIWDSIEPQTEKRGEGITADITMLNKSRQIKDYPDFTDPVWGIAYCFKYLVPEAIKRFGNTKTLLFLKRWITAILSWDKEPTLEFCEQIEKLIEAENEQ